MEINVVGIYSSRSPLCSLHILSMSTYVLVVDLCFSEQHVRAGLLKYEVYHIY